MGEMSEGRYNKPEKPFKHRAGKNNKQKKRQIRQPQGSVGKEGEKKISKKGLSPEEKRKAGGELCQVEVKFCP